MLSGAIFDVANKIEQIKDDEAKTLAPDFWNDQLKAQALMKEIKPNIGLGCIIAFIKNLRISLF